MTKDEAVNPIDHKRRLILGLPFAIAPLGCDREKDLLKVEVDMNTRFQTLEGFGTSLIGWKDKWAKVYQDREFVDFYVNDLGASVVRVDLSEGAVPERARWQDISADDFSFEGRGRRAGNLLFSAQAFYRASKSKLKILGTVWSPPAWMKQNGLGVNGNENKENFALSVEELSEPLEKSRERMKTGNPYLYGNKLRHDRYEHFAKSLVEWTRLYEKHGMSLYGIGPQNEPRFSHWFGSTVYTGPELARAVATIARIFAHQKTRLPKLFAPETMTHDVAGNRAYLDAFFSGSRPGRHLSALASHGYVDGEKSDDSPDSPARFYQLAKPYDLPIWMTEGGTGDHEWPAPLHQLAAAIMNSLAKGHASLITPWQVVDEVKNTHALMPLSGPTKKTHVAKHFFRFLRPGMVRVSANYRHEDKLSLAAFMDKKQVIVLGLNRTDSEKDIRFSFGNASAKLKAHYLTDAHHDLFEQRPQNDTSLTLPRESLSTLVFRRA